MGGVAEVTVAGAPRASGPCGAAVGDRVAVAAADEMPGTEAEVGTSGNGTEDGTAAPEVGVASTTGADAVAAGAEGGVGTSGDATTGVPGKVGSGVFVNCRVTLGGNDS